MLKSSVTRCYWIIDDHGRRQEILETAIASVYHLRPVGQCIIRNIPQQPSLLHKISIWLFIIYLSYVSHLAWSVNLNTEKNISPLQSMSNQ